MKSIEEYRVRRREAEVWWAEHELMDGILASLDTLTRSPNTVTQRLTKDRYGSEDAASASQVNEEEI